MDDKEPKGKAKGNGKLERVNFPITWTIGETIPDRIVKPIELGAIYWLKPEELGYKENAERGATLRHPVVVVGRVDKPFFLELDKGQSVNDVPAVYFVALMSSRLPMEEKYIGTAAEFFKKPINYKLESTTHPIPLGSTEINKGMAQAALGSLLADHKHEGSSEQKPLIMPVEQRVFITKQMKADFTRRFNNKQMKKFNPLKYDLDQSVETIPRGQNKS